MKNLINGGYAGEIYPINPKADEIMGRKAYKSVSDIPGTVDVAVFTIPAPLVAGALEEVGKKNIPAAILIPSGFAETGNVEGQQQIVEIAKKYKVRLMGPNIYGYYYTHSNLCATFCTPYDVKGAVALSSQSGGIGMAILGFARSSGMGVSAIVGLGNKSDLDEDDLLTFFEQDENTQCIAMHMEDLKDGRTFVEVARRVSKKKPVVVLKAGRTAYGAKAASSHTAALAGDDKVYDDLLRSAGVVRAPGLNAGAARAAGAERRERRDHHRRGGIRCAALRRVLEQRPDADGDAVRPGRRVPQVHPAVRRGREPGRHHRRRTAGDVPQHGRARTRRRAYSRPGPRLLAHDRDPAHGFRKGHRRGGRGVPREGHQQAGRRLAGG
jgi:acyl-CoA synthetase (NDP forming)